MTSAIDSVATHPIPSRLLDGPEVPFIGPHLEAYKKMHAETVGPNADKWWAKVGHGPSNTLITLINSFTRWRERLSIGTVLSLPCVPAPLRTVISLGSPKVPSTLLTTALTAGPSRPRTRYDRITAVRADLLTHDACRPLSSTRPTSRGRVAISAIASFYAKCARSPTCSSRTASRRATRSRSTCP